MTAYIFDNKKYPSLLYNDGMTLNLDNMEKVYCATLPINDYRKKPCYAIYFRFIKNDYEIIFEDESERDAAYSEIKKLISEPKDVKYYPA